MTQTRSWSKTFSNVKNINMVLDPPLFFPPPNQIIDFAVRLSAHGSRVVLVRYKGGLLWPENCFPDGRHRSRHHSFPHRRNSPAQRALPGCASSRLHGRQFRAAAWPQLGCSPAVGTTGTLPASGCCWTRPISEQSWLCHSCDCDVGPSTAHSYDGHR